MSTETQQLQTKTKHTDKLPVSYSNEVRSDQVPSDILSVSPTKHALAHPGCVTFSKETNFLLLHSGLSNQVQSMLPGNSPYKYSNLI